TARIDFRMNDFLLRCAPPRAYDDGFSQPLAIRYTRPPAPMLAAELLAGRIGKWRKFRQIAALAPMLQCPQHAGKSQLLPREFIPGEQANIGAFRAGRDISAEQPRAVHHLHLADARDVVNR